MFDMYKPKTNDDENYCNRLDCIALNNIRYATLQTVCRFTKITFTANFDL